MKEYIIIFSSLFLISFVNLKLTNEERQYLLNKYTKKISLDNLYDLKNLKNKFNSHTLKDTIDYDPAKIEGLLETYGFPEEYNYLEDKNATIRVKDQAYCGCCWSHAATTSLAYRYLELGIDVDLSPQDGLSCYLRDCEIGNYLIDPELNLIKNGTLTEGCLPFSSGDGISMEPCPTSCKDGSEFKKYYAQNAYMTEDYYSQDTFYDIVILIIDQLTNYGPVVAGIDVYSDFITWHSDPKKCHDEVYIYDEKSEFEGGHAVTIVGYGNLNGKFYWLIQNSWGKDACDKGFVKVGFGQIGVECIAFAEPYIKKEGIIPEEIPVSFVSLDEECNLELKTTSSYDKWENTLDIDFKHEKESKNFNFQCSAVNFPNQGTQLKCYYEYFNFYSYKGIYKYQSSQSLGTENKFILDDTFNEKKFEFWGLDYITFVDSDYLYISEEGSKILFLYTADGGDESILPNIYANSNSPKPLSDCHKAQLPSYKGDFSYIYCNIKENEVDYFKDLSHQDDNPMVYDILCGYKEITETIAYKLDKTIYPVFKIKKLYYPNSHNVTEYDEFTVIVDIEGSVKRYDKTNMFYFFINVEQNQKNSSMLMPCMTGIPESVGNNKNITCTINIDRGKTLLYDNIYILPFFSPYYTQTPYDVIIKETIKGEEKPEPEPEPDFSNYINISLSLIITFILILV